MSIFDGLDERLSAAVGRVLNDPIIWRPMRQRANRYTNGGWEPDPTRPVLTVPGIVTWRPTVIDSGTNVTEGGGVSAFDVMIDFLEADFPDGLPKQGDIFEVENVTGRSRLQIARPPGDDGSARVFYWATAVQ